MVGPCIGPPQLHESVFVPGGSFATSLVRARAGFVGVALVETRRLHLIGQPVLARYPEKDIEGCRYLATIQELPRFLPIALELLKIRRLLPCGFSLFLDFTSPGSSHHRAKNRAISPSEMRRCLSVLLGRSNPRLIRRRTDTELTLRMTAV